MISADNGDASANGGCNQYFILYKQVCWLDCSAANHNHHLQSSDQTALYLDYQEVFIFFLTELRTPYYWLKTYLFIESQ
jgi:hypothetical protein